MQKVPYYPLKRVNDSFGDSLNQAVLDVVNSGWFIRGAAGEKFQQEFAEYCGAKHCVGVGNGLEALSLILKGYVAMGCIEPGEGVVVPSNTFIATWLAVTAAGLVPVPAEPDEVTSLINAQTVSEALETAEECGVKVAAILAVHLYGRLCPMRELSELANKSNVLLLEDAAQAHGATMTINGKSWRAGNLGHAAGFSFYPGKNLGALGDGGAVVTNDKALAEVVAKLGNYGSARKYIHEFAGENSRLDEMQAAVLSLKLKRLDADNEARRKIAERYLAEIKNPLVRLPQISAANRGEHVWHIFAVHCSAERSSVNARDLLRTHLENLGIESLIHYPIPPHLQRAFADPEQPITFPVAERLACQELSLPLHPFMTEEEIAAVIDGVNSFEGAGAVPSENRGAVPSENSNSSEVK